MRKELVDLFHRFEILLKHQIREFWTRQSTSGEETYSNSELVKSIIAKTEQAQRKISESNTLAMESFRIAFALLASAPDIKNVVDIGGGAGYQYFNAKRLTDNQLNWHVIETPKMVELARQSPELKEICFHANFEDLVSKAQTQIDLVFCSRALQYFDDPLDVIEKIVQISPKIIFLSGMTYSPDSHFHNLFQESLLSNNGPGKLPDGYSDQLVRYPFQLIPSVEIKKILNKSYDIILMTEEEPVVHRYQSQPIPYNGILARRRNA